VSRSRRLHLCSQQISDQAPPAVDCCHHHQPSIKVPGFTRALAFTDVHEGQCVTLSREVAAALQNVTFGKSSSAIRDLIRLWTRHFDRRWLPVSRRNL